MVFRSPHRALTGKWLHKILVLETLVTLKAYRYLRWFDLPLMLKYADWVNMMTYDLHGTSFG